MDKFPADEASAMWFETGLWPERFYCGKCGPAHFRKGPNAKTGRWVRLADRDFDSFGDRDHRRDSAVERSGLLVRERVGQLEDAHAGQDAAVIGEASPEVRSWPNFRSPGAHCGMSCASKKDFGPSESVTQGASGPPR